MKRKPGLLLRNDRYYARLRVPQDLVHALDRQEIKKALNTSDRSEAEAKLDLRSESNLRLPDVTSRPR